MFIKKHRYTIILILAILVILVYVGVKWYEGRMRLVDIGMADPMFPFREYSILELARQGKVTDYVPELEEAIKNLPTRTTPQETFDIYIQALKDGDIERAVGYMREGAQGYEREDLYSIRNRRELEKTIKGLEEINSKLSWDDEEIERNSTGKWKVYYRYSCSLGERSCGVGFSKDFYGDWKLNKGY